MASELLSVKTEESRLYIYIYIYMENANQCPVNNLFKESFMRKEKKINILTAFFISHKSGVKNFLK